MKTFSNFLQESFNTPYHWEWTTKKSDQRYARFFDSNSHKFIVRILEIQSLSFVPENSWTLDFVYKKSEKSLPSWDNTNFGNPLAIFSTVIDITKSFIKLKKPAQIQFFATEPNKAKLYVKLLKKFEAELKTLEYEIVNDTDYFTIQKRKNQ